MPGAAEAFGGELDAEAALARRDEVIHDRDDPASFPGSRTSGSSWCAGAARSTASAASPSATTCSSARKAVVVAPARRRRCRRSTGCATPSRGPTARRRPRRAVPESLVVLGGGPVGVELAQAWSTLGATVFARRGRGPRAAPGGAVRERRGRRRPARDRRRRPRGHEGERGLGAGRRGHGRARGRRAAARRAAAGRDRAQAADRRAQPRLGGRRDQRAGYLEVDDQLRVGAATGSTPRATSTAAPC